MLPQADIAINFIKEFEILYCKVNSSDMGRPYDLVEKLLDFQHSIT